MKANLILVVLLIGSAIVFAQESNEESLFNQGVEAYKQGRYEAAQQTFLQIWQQYPSGRLITATRLMLAKSYYKLGDYPKVENLCLNFFNKFPDSKYLDDMHHLLGNTMFKLHRYMRAVEEWLWVIENSRDPRLKRLAGEYTFQTMDHFLSPNQIEALRRDHPNAEFDGLAKVVLAKKLLRKGEKQRANRLLRSFLREQPNHFYADEARRLLGKPTVRGVTRNGFVFLKPTDPQVKKIGDEMELGMQYAIFEYRQRNPREKIGFQSFDVSPSVLSALKTAEEAMELNDPLCMIGPIQADPCAALSMMSRYERIPYIIPLSSQAGLTGLSQYSFQLNPDAHTKGRFLGDYASQKLQLKRIAVIAPVNEYGQDFVESFVEEVQANGAEIATIQWYY
ncbi:MAG: outer membrane protein assembly factor BamD, partial [Calditrichaeota bacterium]